MAGSPYLLNEWGKKWTREGMPEVREKAFSKILATAVFCKRSLRASEWRQRHGAGLASALGLALTDSLPVKVGSGVWGRAYPPSLGPPCADGCLHRGNQATFTLSVHSESKEGSSHWRLTVGICQSLLESVVFSSVPGNQLSQNIELTFSLWMEVPGLKFVSKKGSQGELEL